MDGLALTLTPLDLALAGLLASALVAAGCAAVVALALGLRGLGMR